MKELEKLARSPEDSDLPSAKTSKTTIVPEEKITKTVTLDPKDPAKVTHVGT